MGYGAMYLYGALSGKTVTNVSSVTPLAPQGVTAKHPPFQSRQYRYRVSTVSSGTNVARATPLPLNLSVVPLVEAPFRRLRACR